MADTDNLRTASLYINNQLLSRGLLRDGSTIDFADPLSGGDLGETMGRIMSVINDLILRRDRDAEHREALSQTLRTLRAENLRQTNHLQRERDAYAESQRRLQTAEASNHSQRVQLTQAESAIHKLKEEAARTKTLVAQTRAACANEVRKRDRQVDSLKKAVVDAGRARGERRGTTVTTITVTGETGGAAGALDGDVPPAPGATASDGYDLRQESNMFLAQLAKGLSADNEALVALVRRTESTLRQMSGFDDEDAAVAAAAAAAAAAAGMKDGNVAFLPGTVDQLSADIDAVLQHLRTILTNPSFVPIEEVVIRDEEIQRLRGGWEKMETRWKEAVHLLDGWRRRMASGGKAVNMEELKMGLRLSPVRVKSIAETSQGLNMRVAPIDFKLCPVREEEESPRDEQPNVRLCPSPAESLHLVPAPGYEDPEEDDDSDSESSIYDDDEDEVDIDELDVSEPNVQILEQSVMMHELESSPMPEPPQLSPLKDSDSAGNRRRPEPSRPRKRPAADFTIITDETSSLEPAPVVADKPPPRRAAQAPATKPRPRPRRVAAAARPAPPVEMPSRPNSAASYTSRTSTTTETSIKLVKPEAAAAARSDAVKQTQPPPAKKRNTTKKPAEAPADSRRPPRPATSMATTRPTRAAAAKAAAAVAAAKGTKKHTRSKSQPDSITDQGCSSSSEATRRTAATKEMPPPPVPAARATRQATVTPAKPAAVVPPPSSSRLPLPRTANANGVPQSPLTMATIQAKLVASERDADAARVRAKLKAARLGRGTAPTAASSASSSRAPSDATNRSADESERGGVSVGSSSSSNSNSSRSSSNNNNNNNNDNCSSSSNSSTGSTGSAPAGESIKKAAPAPLSPVPEPDLAASGQTYSPTLRVVGACAEPAPQPCLQELSVRKRGRRAERVASRRRSTLNPWELKTLISGDVPVSPCRRN